MVQTTGNNQFGGLNGGCFSDLYHGPLTASLVANPAANPTKFGIRIPIPKTLFPWQRNQVRKSRFSTRKSPSIVKNVHLQDIMNVDRKCDHDGFVVVNSVLVPNVMGKEQKQANK